MRYIVNIRFGNVTVWTVPFLDPLKRFRATVVCSGESLVIRLASILMEGEPLLNPTHAGEDKIKRSCHEKPYKQHDHHRH